MAYLVFPDKRLRLNALSIFVCFVLILCCQVSCEFVNVTRYQLDIFAYSLHSNCATFCRTKRSYRQYSGSRICGCQCEDGNGTFVTAELKCVANEDLRNGELEFKLYIGETLNGRLEVIPLDSRTTRIKFDVQDEYDENCTLNDIEELSYRYFKQWKSVLGSLSNHSFKKTEMKKSHNDDWMMLTLNWNVSPSAFVGRIMRLNVTCNEDEGKNMTGVMVFKVQGTFQVPDNSSTSSTFTPGTTFYYPTPTPFIETSSLVYSTTSMAISSSMILSSFQPMTSSSFGPLMISSTFSTSKSSFSVSTRSLLYSSTMSSMVVSSAVPGPMTSKSSNKAAVTGGIVAGVVVLLLIIILLVYALRKRRMTVLRRKHSDLDYINASTSSLTHLPAMSNPLSDGVAVYENPEVVDGSNRRSGVTSIESAAYDACLVVENPSARETKSVYDNIPEPAEPTYKTLDPSKREPSAKYQSLIRPNDHEYATLADTVSGAKQEPLYSEVLSGPSSAPHKNGGPKASSPPPVTPTRPVSSVVAEPIYNELESSGNQTNDNNSMPSSQPHRESSTISEPIYNELENSGSQAEEGVKAMEKANTTPSPQKPDSPTVAEPIYNELHEGNGQENINDERPNDLVNGLEESNETDGENGPVYSVLEEKQV